VHDHRDGAENLVVHLHEHAHDRRRVAVERSLLAENEKRAARLREQLAARGIDSVGLVGAPGSGKTALLEASLARLGTRAMRQAVVEGDCATDHDARRIAAAGARVVQVATGSLCHLDAHLVEHALEHLDLDGVERLFIENVGNLVCPAPFACGEARRVVLVSVAEGDDKPEKYPAIFAVADLLVVTKADLLPHVSFDLERCIAGARRARPDLPALVLSARSGTGMAEWLAWLTRSAAEA
jgi:hydrogenase nickel incorporation protein HypB